MTIYATYNVIPVSNDCMANITKIIPASRSIITNTTAFVKTNTPHINTRSEAVIAPSTTHSDIIAPIAVLISETHMIDDAPTSRGIAIGLNMILPLGVLLLSSPCTLNGLREGYTIPIPTIPMMKKEDILIAASDSPRKVRMD